MMMNSAIIGAGFAGLALTWHLLQKGFQITLFDSHGVGGGASGSATGLLHPYPGEQVRRSRFAEEGMRATEELLQVAESTLNRPVSLRNGILRTALNEEQIALLVERASQYGDIERLDHFTFLITSGITVNPSLHLQGLWQACEKRGARLQKTKISSLEELKEYDLVIIAAGAGVATFEECRDLPLSFIKGQSLTFARPQEMTPLERGAIAKGHITPGESPDVLHVGATYERAFDSEEPDLAKAKELLLPLVAAHFPALLNASILGCRAGIRVSCRGDYFPLVKKLNEKTWVVTGLGSRGLLYHAYLAEMLASKLTS